MIRDMKLATLFIDESGKSSLATIDNQPFLLTGVIKENYQVAIRARLNAICFAEKGFLSGGLEITDLISYISYLRARRMMSMFVDAGVDIVWSQILGKATILRLKEGSIWKFFGIKKGEVHKYLK